MVGGGGWSWVGVGCVCVEYVYVQFFLQNHDSKGYTICVGTMSAFSLSNESRCFFSGFRFELRQHFYLGVIHNEVLSDVGCGHLNVDDEI